MPKSTVKKRELLRKLNGEAAKRGKPKGTWTPEIVRQRIRLGLLTHRMQDQALGLLDDKWEICSRPLLKDGQLVMGEDGKPAREYYRRSKAMTALQFAAAQALVNKCLPNAEAPKDINLNGSLTLIDRDPTERPVNYQRRAARPATPTE